VTSTASRARLKIENVTFTLSAPEPVLANKPNAPGGVFPGGGRMVVVGWQFGILRLIQPGLFNG